VVAPSDSSELVRRLVDGDPSALEDAFREHAARCNAIAFRVLGDDQYARDAVQEAFLSLWRHRHGLVVRSAGIGPWLTVVTRNAALTILRSARARSRREERAVPEETMTIITSDPAEIVSANVDAHDVRGAIASLPAEQQAVIKLAYFRFLTMAQIAERTETPLGTVKRRAQLALRTLGRILSEQRS
jgi:RNA polymerase sigma factor (sigma-70 family)